jgi:hypothetical protein|tara:strand:+ start:575 stop:709 length:135 start_codon:yes stop_codon:yes gene_type:complete
MLDTGRSGGQKPVTLLAISYLFHVGFGLQMLKHVACAELLPGFE